MSPTFKTVALSLVLGRGRRSTMHSVGQVQDNWPLDQLWARMGNLVQTRNKDPSNLRAIDTRGGSRGARGG